MSNFKESDLVKTTKHMILEEEGKLIKYKEEIISLAEDNSVTYDSLFNVGKDVIVLEFVVDSKEYSYYFAEMELGGKLKNLILAYNSKLRDLFDEKMNELKYNDYERVTFLVPNGVGYNVGIINVDYYLTNQSIEADINADNEDEGYEVDCTYCDDRGCVQCEPHRFLDCRVSYN